MKQAKSRWRDVLLVCRKCSGKAGGGFGAKGRTPLAKALRAEAGLGKGRKAEGAVIEIGCLKICPKNAVMLVDAAHPAEWLVVPVGADVGEVLARTGLARRAGPPEDITGPSNPAAGPGPKSVSPAPAPRPAESGR